MRQAAKMQAAEHLLPASDPMEIHLLSEHGIRLTSESPAFSIEPVDASLSPFHLLAASLATCTWSVLVGYAGQADIPVDDLRIDVSWELGGDPYRVTRMGMALHWPRLPENRRTAAERVAARCTIHHTLQEGAHVDTEVTTGGDPPDPPGPDAG